jgi:hypothetical protein
VTYKWKVKNVKNEGLLNEIIPWHYFTKERLSADDLTQGLLNYGLFSEKLPPCFTTEGFSAVVKNLLAPHITDVDEKSLSKTIKENSADYIRYEALRDSNVPRHFGIPHPAAYAIQVLGIARHWEQIAIHCNKPNPQFSRVHVRQLSSARVFEMNYKGNDRYLLEETELEWMAGAKYIVKADVASCFPSIYTHSIPWALHGKAVAKKPGKLTDLAGNFLDKVTQGTRDKQTNGLLVGPHTSNVISEIILTSIDVDLQQKGHKKICRHVDDYTYYADTHEQAERFIKDLSMCLRAYEMSLNDKKTQILNLPRPSTENWIHRLNTFNFPNSGELRISAVRSYLDLALECSQQLGKSTPLNYAIKTLSGKDGNRQLNSRAKRMYTQEAINLALAFPYLAPLLDKYVFEKFVHPGQRKTIGKFCSSLVVLGLQKLYPDAISHALYYALRYEVKLALEDTKLAEIIEIDDCLTNVLLLEYAFKFELNDVLNLIKKRAEDIKTGDQREISKNWLLVYQCWTEDDLRGNGQQFLASLKKISFNFVRIPPLHSVSTLASQSTTS